MKKLILIIFIASIYSSGVAVIAANASGIVATTPTAEERNIGAILEGSQANESQQVILAAEQEPKALEAPKPADEAKPVDEPKPTNKLLASTNEPISAPAHKEKGIFSTIIGWFSSNEEKSEPVVVTQPKKVQKPVIIGLALGGGAAKGFAHIGVIKALEANGIKPQIITGTSAGSLVGSLYSYGYSSKQLEKIAYQLDGMNLADFTISGNGLIKGQKLQDFVNKQVQNQQLQKLKIRFAAIATDLDSGQGVAFNNGDTGAAVRASCSVPNIFLPVRINNHRYVDGGLSAPVPVSYAKNMGANLIIAVDITSKPEHNKASGFLSNFDQTINIMGVKLLNEQLKLANFTVKPDISKLSSFNFNKKQHAIDLGYKATLPLIPKIKQHILQMQNQ